MISARRDREEKGAESHGLPHPFIFRRKRILRSGVERSPAVRQQREDLPRKEQKAIAELKERVSRDWDGHPLPDSGGGQGRRADMPVATFGAHLCWIRTMFTSFVSSTAKRQRGLQRESLVPLCPVFCFLLQEQRKSLPDRHTDNLKRLGENFYLGRIYGIIKTKRRCRRMDMQKVAELRKKSQYPAHGAGGST